MKVPGYFRIKFSDFGVYEKKGNFWRKSEQNFENALEVIRLFKLHDNLELIRDSKDLEFFKGGILGERVVGERIDFLPNGEVLDKAYSLFSPDLTIHDEDSSVHWDVIFRNPNGKFAYLYTKEKEKLSKEQKYKRVEEFSKKLPLLRRNLERAIDEDLIALPMIVLLKTRMRVGGEIYYKKSKNKGLSTLKKRDVKLSGNKVFFSFVGKAGVPQKIIVNFSDKVIGKIKKILSNKKLDDFIFLNSKRKVYKDTEFEIAFEKYCGIRFYPHIVRSYYATQEVKKFLNKNKTFSKEEVKRLFLRIADGLGHKKFSKKKNSWEDSYEVTINHYIEPDLVEEVSKKQK